MSETPTPAERPPEESHGMVKDWLIRTFDPWLESRKHSNTLIIAALILVSLPVIGVGIFLTRSVVPYDRILQVIQLPGGGAQEQTSPITAVFQCTDGRSMTAVFSDSSVDLTLSDGRHFSLPRAISASGARYANSDESFVFWNKGDTAFIEENGTTTYSGCATSQ
jgi:membrane-bound inhibitor of C-type lysozyme